MKNGNCGSCPHLHRCRATNNDECIDTIIGRKHYMSNREKQIREDAIDELLSKIHTTWLFRGNDAKAYREEIEYIAEQLKENNNV